MNNKVEYCLRMVERNLPFHVRYFLMFCRSRRRMPYVFSKQDYNDYIFWDCYFNRHKKHAYLADKYEVRHYVEEKGLGSILTKLYGVWDSSDEIDFEKLPNQFAIKCNHSCGMNIIVHDKANSDIGQIRNHLAEWLKMKHTVYFERHYNFIKPRIICEELIPSELDGTFPIDYKIHCANGKPVFIQCCTERTETSVGKRVVYSPQWEKMPFTVHDILFTDEDIDRPTSLDEMLKVASILSKDLKYARIDLYEVRGRVLFGEITLTPMGGILNSLTPEALKLMGEEIRKNNK